MEKRFLIVVDMQKDFIDGSLGTAEAQAMLPAAAAHIRERRSAGWTVIGTLDTHGADYLNTAEGRRLPVPHCIRGTEGWRLDPAIAAEMAGCALVEKPAFGSMRLPELVRQLVSPEDGVTIELMGLCTDICVVSNALLLKAAFPEAAMQVKAACCAGVTPEKHLAALETMASCQIDII